MEGHDMMKTTPTRHPITTTTPKPNSYEDTSFDVLEDAASARIDNVYRVLPPKNFYRLHSGTPQYVTYPHNFQYIPNVDKVQKSGAYMKFQQQYPAYSTTTPPPNRYNFENYPAVPLTGPMVVRVYPDGRPVSETKPQMPQDEDLRQYQMSKIRIPNI